MGNINLDSCKLITGAEYCKLNEPIFMGQTRADKHGMYYMVWFADKVLYKTKNYLEGCKPKHDIKLNGDMANEFNNMQEDSWMENEMDDMY